MVPLPQTGARRLHGRELLHDPVPAGSVLWGEPGRTVSVWQPWRAGVEERVRFPGKFEEKGLADYYRACDLFAVPSGRDGADVEAPGVAFLDAAACGRPVLATLPGGIPDAVEHGRTGLLVEPRNADEAAAAMRRLLNDRGCADRLGRQGRSRVEESFTWDPVCRRGAPGTGGSNRTATG